MQKVRTFTFQEYFALVPGREFPKKPGFLHCAKVRAKSEGPLILNRLNFTNFTIAGIPNPVPSISVSGLYVRLRGVGAWVDASGLEVHPLARVAEVVERPQVEALITKIGARATGFPGNLLNPGFQ